MSDNGGWSVGVCRGVLAFLLTLLLLMFGCTDREAPDAEAVRLPTGAEQIRAQLEALRRPVHGHEILRVGSALYSLGGYTSAGAGSESATLLRFDLRRLEVDAANATWEPVSEAPFAAGFIAAATDGRTLWYVRDGVHRYDPQEKTWSSWRHGGRVPRSHHEAVWFDERLWILGGYPKAASDFLMFDPRSGRLKAMPRPPDFKPTDHMHFMFVVGDSIHVVGGVRRQCSGPSRLHASFDGEAWTVRAPAPVELWRKFQVAAVHGDQLFIFDETHGLRYDPETDTWSATLAPLPEGLIMAQAVAVGNSVFVIGGRAFGRRGPVRYGALRYEVARNTWTSATRGPR